MEHTRNTGALFPQTVTTSPLTEFKGSTLTLAPSQSESKAALRTAFRYWVGYSSRTASSRLAAGHMPEEESFHANSSLCQGHVVRQEGEVQFDQVCQLTFKAMKRERDWKAAPEMWPFEQCKPMKHLQPAENKKRGGGGFMAFPPLFRGQLKRE